jgi:type II secretory pathway pseudopilin PulG
MKVAGHAKSTHNGALNRDEAGYAMAVLLVALGVMAVMLTVAMPVWKQMAQREKEEELIFRGQQYARAIGLFQRRAGPGVLPPNLDVLVQQRFLRKKFKDPITGEDFQPLVAGQPTPGAPGIGAPPGGRGVTSTGAGGSPGGTSPATGRGGPGMVAGAPPQPGQVPGVAGAPTGAVGGIQGVVSKSKAKSIRLYNGRNAYNEWAFVYVPQVQAPGGGAPGTGRGRGQQPPGGPGVGTPGRGGQGTPTPQNPPFGRGPGRGPAGPAGPGRSPFPGN